MRGTYGRSFQAPLLADTNPVTTDSIVYPLSNPSGGSPVNSLLVTGGNPDLLPETAKTWTGGVDLHLSRHPALTVSATYYNIQFSNRIASAEQTVPNALDALAYANLLGPSIIQRNPSLALVQQLSNTPYYFNPFNIDPSTIAAIVDFREKNLSTVTTNGVDLSASDIEPTVLGELHLGIDGTYILAFKNRFTVNAPEVSVLNTIYNPVDFRLRGQLGLVVGQFSGTLFVNYTDSYKNNDVSPPTAVASWCTADVSLTYDLERASAPTSTNFNLVVTNIANRDPPFVINPTWGINYDGANANALGRVYAVQVTTRW
jgi:outer membrane receptor protein involved in Fe transport